jgi:hypothetical protein
MNDLYDPLESIWDGLLSHDPAQIIKSYNSLDPSSQRSAWLHLKRMVSEEGWLPVQQQSAQIALDALQSIGIEKVPSQE